MIYVNNSHFCAHADFINQSQDTKLLGLDKVLEFFLFMTLQAATINQVNMTA